MTEVCFENHNKVFVEKGRISERCFEPCRVKGTVAKQREVALQRNKINRYEGLVWSVISYSILPGLLLFQDMALLWVMGTFECPTCHWSPQFSQLNWAPVKSGFGLPKKSKSQRESPRQGGPLWNIWSLLSGDWIKRNYLPRSMTCFCLGRVRVLWSVLHLVCSYDLCRGFSRTILRLVELCHLAVEQRNQSLTIIGSLTKILREQ